MVWLENDLKPSSCKNCKAVVVARMYITIFGGSNQNVVKFLYQYLTYILEHITKVFYNFFSDTTGHFIQ